MAGSRHTTKAGVKRSCRQKRRYPARWLAERAVAFRVAQGAYEARLSAYPCRFCGGHHVGHVPAAKLNSRR